MAPTGHITAAVTATQVKAIVPELRPAAARSTRASDFPAPSAPPATTSSHTGKEHPPNSSQQTTGSAAYFLPAEPSQAAVQFRQLAGLQQYKKQSRPFTPDSIPPAGEETTPAGETRIRTTPAYVLNSYRNPPSSSVVDIIY